MNISAPFIHRPIATSLLMAGILLVGIVGLSAAAGGAAAAGRFPDHPGQRQPARAPARRPWPPRSRTPLETQFVADPGRDADDLDQRARLDADHAAVRPDRNIDAAAQDVQAAINAAGGQLPKNLPAPPTYPQGQPGRRADPDPGGALRHAAAHDGRRLRREHPRAADLADRGRRPGRSSAASRSRRCASRSIRARSPRWACSSTTSRSVIAAATVNAPKGSINGAAAQLHRSTTTTSCSSATPWNDVIVAYHNGAPVRIRDIGAAVDGPENDAAGGLAERQAAASCCSSSSSPAPTSSTPSTRIKAALPQLQADDPAGDQGRHHQSTAP